MNIFTSNFARSSRALGAISIAKRSAPWFRGPSYLPLAPTKAILADVRTFDGEYDKLLSTLNPEDVVRDLLALAGSPQIILLCWEGVGVRCHRRRVAEWLESELKIEVTELGRHRGECQPYRELQSKRKTVKREDQAPDLFNQSPEPELMTHSEGDVS